MSRSVFSLAIQFASVLFILPVAVASAGEEEVRAALVLIEDNQERLRELAKKHRETILDARADMVHQANNVQYEPGAYEAALFEGEGGQTTRRAVGQLEVARRILAAEAASKDSKVATGAAAVRALADRHEAYLLKTVESAVYDMSFERMHREDQALDEAYEQQRKKVPFWAATLVGREARLDAYAGQIRAAAAKVKLQGLPGREGPTLVRLPSGEIGNAERTRSPQSLANASIPDGEYQAKKKAYEARLAEQERQREQRLAEQRQAASPRPAPASPARPAPAAQPAPAAAPPDQSTVAAWHAGFYQAKIVPFKKALGEILAIQDRGRRTAQLVESCTRLSASSVALLGEQRLQSGTPAVDLSLRAVLETYDRASQACVVGKMAELASGLASGEAALGKFAAALAPYRLAP